MSSLSGTLQAATFPEFVDPNPAPGNHFGATVVALSTGNVVVTSPYDDAGGMNGVDVGAVYLFNGSTGALISTLRGSTAGDQVGKDGVTALSNGNYVVVSTYWDNGAQGNAGAVTWGSGTTGVSGVVSAANSLVGSALGDFVGNGGVTALANGNYVVGSPAWNNGALYGVGAVTWGSGTTGVSGVVSASNSLVGSTTGDYVGSGHVTALSDGDYVVASPSWDTGGFVNVGAATWCSGITGRAGVVSAANSLVGSKTDDQVGKDGVTALSNGSYVVVSTLWGNGLASNVGAVTWGSGTTGVSGVVSATNSLVGSTLSDKVGYRGVTALTNGSYVVSSPAWNNGTLVDAGAATWGSGATGVSGVVSAANSLVGSTSLDYVGNGGATALSNGNYVVSSPNWDVSSLGAATWGNGTTGRVGAVSAANSLVGSTASDYVASGGVTALSNGNYVVSSPVWDNGAVVNAGAATWGSGTTGRTGVVSAGNSLVGTTSSDNVGTTGVTALSNGNYVVSSRTWDNGAVLNAGAVTWCRSTGGTTGAVTAANSLVGSTADDQVGYNGVTELSNGSYVVRSPIWNNGAVVNAGAATWGSGTTGVSGLVSAANSLVGSTADDTVGSGVTALSNGNYVVLSPEWHNGVAVAAGAVTWGSGTTGVSGVVSAANSLVGSTAGDHVGSTGVTALSNGNYVVASARWDNGSVPDAGAVTWGGGATGVGGAVSVANSLVGTTANTSLHPVVTDDVNDSYFARFVDEAGGRVLVGPLKHPVVSSAVDIPSDQGGWLRLTFSRSTMDDAGGSPPVATYGVWRLVPGTIFAGAASANPGAAAGPGLEAPGTEWLRAAAASGLDVREVEGRLCVTGPGKQAVGIATAFPPGTWALVTSVPAVQQAQYVVEVPTISNAAPNDFVVTAHTTTPTIWFISQPASGLSVDNLAPAQPTLLTAAYSGGQTNLAWAANTEHDLGSYRLYRGTSADFTPAAGNRIATPISTSYADAGAPGGYYKLSAVDVNGNESGFALVTPAGTTGVDGELPVSFALEGARPNPASRSGLHVAFALPTGVAARIELLDVSGRRVRVREVGPLGAGRHTVNLAEGRAVASGLYWVRLTQGTNRQTKRVAVIE
jgi:hypothetical protein